MRYMIQFADKTTKKVSEEEGQLALVSWSQGHPVIIRGAGFANHLISAIKPINKDWYEDDYVNLESRGEDANFIDNHTDELVQIAKAL